MRKKICSLLLVFVVGCSDKTPTNSLLSEWLIIPPRPNSLPPTPPPSFIPDSSEIQVNSIPHPFNLNGTRPYAVWVNGKRLQLSPHQTNLLTQSLNIRFSQPKDTAEIHNGSGWQRPLDEEDGKSDIQRFFEE
jgi:hypothetical protein